MWAKKMASNLIRQPSQKDVKYLLAVVAPKLNIIAEMLQDIWERWKNST